MVSKGAVALAACRGLWCLVGGQTFAFAECLGPLAQVLKQAALRHTNPQNDHKKKL